MIADKLDGGLNMVDYRLKDIALKTMMLKRILEPGDEMWKETPLYYIKTTGHNSLLFHVNIPPHEIEKDMYIPSFYKKLISSFHACKCNVETDTSPKTAIDVRKQIIWGNNKIKYKGKPLWCKKWIMSNIIVVNDLYDANGRFNEQSLYVNIQDKTNVISELFKVKNAIPDSWKQILQNDPCKINVKQPSISDIQINYCGTWLYLEM